MGILDKKKNTQNILTANENIQYYTTGNKKNCESSAKN